ncbi:MAG: PspC domain-containing protein [Bacteroidales bacterium]|nr:PspC domain-containing protein [Bacteroidales bacterium]
MDEKRLYRSVVDRVIGGVCAGIGDYLNIDPVIIRIIFVLLAIFGGGGVIIYIVLWIVLPEEYPNIYNASTNTYNTMENEKQNTENQNTAGQPGGSPYGHGQHHPKRKNSGSLVGGIILIAIGGMFLVDEFVYAVSFGDLWPIILVVIGIAIIVNNYSGQKSQ